MKYKENDKWFDRKNTIQYRLSIKFLWHKYVNNYE